MRASPYILPGWTLGLYLVASRAARLQQLGMMTATVETLIVVEVDEVYQGLPTGLAGKAGPVPAALLPGPGCEHPVLSGPQPLPALPGAGAGRVRLAPSAPTFPLGSSTPLSQSQPNSFLHCRLHQEPPNLASLSPKVSPFPQAPFPNKVPVQQGVEEREWGERGLLPSHRCVLPAWEAAGGPPPVPGPPASAGHRRASALPAPPPQGPGSSAPAETGLYYDWESPTGRTVIGERRLSCWATGRMNTSGRCRR